ncbi:hypothetical protein [Solitalea lacus]|uniref:hypothetical protein n=1 Tax=Solitalea lacus TaxID=2911172 RepID=UPI001EDBCB91|nr:hypothetical protein [Solitalea lacus]UKJ06615.1 hypothetical protein L2B55_13885 [Solitalea lacus]
MKKQKLVTHLTNNWNALLYIIGILALILLFSQLRFTGEHQSKENTENSSKLTNITPGIPVPNDTTPPPNHELKHIMIKTEVWAKLAHLTYRKELINGEQWTFPIFGPEIKAMEGETITLKGYLIPLEQGKIQQHFMISVLPLNQCYFCGKSKGVPEMVEVHMNVPIDFTDKVIAIKGILQLNERDEEHFALMLMGAEME